MSFYIQSILNKIRENSNLKYENLNNDFNNLSKNVSKNIHDQIIECMHQNKGDLDMSYADLFNIYKKLIRIERRISDHGEILF
jgi:hypothetical protein